MECVWGQVGGDALDLVVREGLFGEGAFKWGNQSGRWLSRGQEQGQRPPGGKGSRRDAARARWLNAVGQGGGSSSEGPVASSRGACRPGEE